jgi:hypothetical protein
MRFAVVRRSLPEIMRRCPPSYNTTAHPPGPEFPWQAPSVKISVRSPPVTELAVTEFNDDVKENLPKQAA